MIAKLIQKIFGKKKLEWWQIPQPTLHHHGRYYEDLTKRYGQPGTELGDQPVAPQNEHGSGIRVMPRWYPSTGYVQPTKENKF